MTVLSNVFNISILCVGLKTTFCNIPFSPMTISGYYTTRDGEHLGSSPVQEQVVNAATAYASRPEVTRAERTMT